MILDCRAVCVLLPRVGRSLNMHSCLVVETPVKKLYITHTELLHRYILNLQHDTYMDT